MLDLVLNLFPLLPHAIQQPAQTRAQILFRISDDSGKALAQVDRLGRKRDAAFQQESTNLVDERGATLDQPVAHTIKGLPVELLLGLELGKAYVLLGYSLGDRFGIKEVEVIRMLRQPSWHLVTTVGLRS